jgi:hypothetical protein
LNALSISNLVAHELANYVYQAPPPGSTLGVPWSEDKIRAYVVQLRATLVTPYLQEFRLSDTVAQIQAVPPESAEYWVVAVSSDYVEFYDPRSGEFGLATQGRVGRLPSTIGVRGDLVGVFCAM